MGRKNGFALRLQAAQALREQQVRHHTRVFMLDMVTAALGRMGFGEKRLDEFDRVLAEVSEEYGTLILEDAETDKDLWYAKECLDRELKQYTGKRFVPYDRRYAEIK